MPQKNALLDNHLLGHPVHIEYRLLVSFLHSPLPLIVHPEQGDMSSSILARQTWRRWGNVLCYSVTPRNSYTLCVPKRNSYTLCVPKKQLHCVLCSSKKQLHSVCLKETTTLCVPQRNSYTLCFAKKQLHCMFPGETASLCVSLNKTVPMCVPH